MLCVQSTAVENADVAAQATFLRPASVERFAHYVNDRLAEPAVCLAKAIARIDDKSFVGGKYNRIVDGALAKLRSWCASELGRTVSDAHILCLCVHCICLSNSRCLGLQSIFDTLEMSPYEPLGNQNKSVWLMMKAAMSIDVEHANDVVRIATDTMPEFMGVLGVLSLVMQTEFGVALFKFQTQCGKMPVANAVFSCPLALQMLMDSLFKLGMSRPQAYNEPDSLKDPWFLIEEHILKTTKMSEAVVCRRRTTVVAVLRVATSVGIRCFARRMKLNSENYCLWAKQCARDLRDDLKSSLMTKRIELSVASKKQLRELQKHRHTDAWWSIDCVDDTSSMNMQIVQKKTKNSEESRFLSACGVFTGLVAVSFVSFVERNVLHVRPQDSS